MDRSTVCVAARLGESVLELGCDRALSVHTLYFWPDLDAGLRELARVLRKEGVLLLGYHPGESESAAARLPDSVYTLRTTTEVEAGLARAGFEAIESAREPHTGVVLTSARCGGGSRVD
ncbi:MAG: class I SAM-dependent methyltransferase [Proteobacteria bacterium]|nr:class I SAM-dependent methyltransferase [Pseudomonadota bacterium]